MSLLQEGHRKSRFIFTGLLMMKDLSGRQPNRIESTEPIMLQDMVGSVLFFLIMDFNDKPFFVWTKVILNKPAAI